MNRKQTIIISVLLVLIVFAGYLATKVNDPLYVGTDGSGALKTSTTSSSFFEEAKTKRNNSSIQVLQSLKSLLDDANTPAEQKAKASEEYKNIALQSDKEQKIELALQSQGYKEVLCTLDKDSATVIVKTEKELSDQNLRQIKDIVMTKANVTNIEVKTAK